MTSYKIENFFGHLDRVQTKEAVTHGANLLSVADLADAVTEGMTRSQIEQLIQFMVIFAAELDVGDAA
jgi:hypothetical protein